MLRYLLLVALVISSEARPNIAKSLLHVTPQADQNDPLRYQHKVDIGESRLTDGVSLHYDVRLHKNIIRLNEIMEVESVKCFENHLELELHPLGLEAFTSGMTHWAEGSPINGDQAWGCKDERGNPTVIMRVLKSVEVKAEEHKIILHTSGKAKIEHFFEDAHISFFSRDGDRPNNFESNLNKKRDDVVENDDGSFTFHTSGMESYIPGQEPKATQDIRPPVHFKSQGDNAGTGRFVTVTEPQYKATYEVGDNINLLWSMNGWLATTPVKIKLKKERWLVWDEDVYTPPGTFTLGDGETGITIAAQAFWRASERYYFQLSWNCNVFRCTTAQSPFFLIPQIKITSPNGDSKYQPGDTMNIAWTSFNVPAATSLKLTVYKDDPLWFDTKLVATQSVANNGAYTTTIPPDARVGLLSYYVQLEWNCGLFGQFCDYSYSERFTFPGQVTNNWNYDEGSQRALEQIPLISFGCSDVLQYCSGTPPAGTGAGRRLLESDAAAAPSSSEGVGAAETQAIHPAPHKSVRPVLSGADRPSARPGAGEVAKSAGFPLGPEVMLLNPKNNNAPVVPKGVAPKPQKHVSTLDTDPTAPCVGGTGLDGGGVGGPTGILAEICKLCQTQGLSIDISLSCSNCWLKYEYTVQKFELIKNGASIESLVVNVQGTAQLNIELMAQIQYRQVFEINQQIFILDLQGKSFQIAGITIHLGMLLTVNFKFNVDFDFTGRLYTEGGINCQYSALTQYGTQYPDSRLDTGHSFTYQTYVNPSRVTVDSTLNARVALLPQLVFTFLNILTVTISAEPFVSWESRFAYPPFPEIGDAPAADALKKFADDCMTPHYFEFTLRAGLGSVSVVANLEIDLPLIHHFSKTITRDYPLPFSNVAILSGCYLAPTSVGDTVVNVDGLAPIDTPEDMHMYQYRVQRDVADAVGVDQSRVNLGDITLDPDTSSTNINVGFSSTLPDVTDDFSGDGGVDPYQPSSWIGWRPENIWGPKVPKRRSSRFKSQAGDDEKPPSPDDFTPAPDVLSASELAQKFQNALGDPSSPIRRPGGVFEKYKQLNIQQAFNPVEGHVATAVDYNPPFDWDSFGAGMGVTIGCILLGLVIFFGHKKYREAHPAGAARKSSSRRYVQAQLPTHEPEPMTYSVQTDLGTTTYAPPVTTSHRAPSRANTRSKVSGAY